MNQPEPVRIPDLKRNLGVTGVIKDMRAPHPKADTGLVRVVLNETYLPDGDPGSEQSVAGVYGVTPVFKNDWQNAGGTSPDTGFYMGDDGEVRFQGHINGGDVGTVVFVLPLNFRPEKDMVFICPNDAGGYAQVEVNTDGEVRVIAVGATVVITS